MPHKLKSGQINFENTAHAGSFACVVIKDGVFHNLSDEMREQLITALSDRTFHDDFDNMFD
jgi:hypothetical protein